MGINQKDIDKIVCNKENGVAMKAMEYEQYKRNAKRCYTQHT